VPRWFRQDNGTVVLDQRRARARRNHHHQVSAETRGLSAPEHHVCPVAIAPSIGLPVLLPDLISRVSTPPRMPSALLRSIFDRLPPRLQGSITKMIRLIRGKSENTFIRVAYTTPRQVVLVTSRHEGVDNVRPMDAHLVLSFQPSLFGIAATRLSWSAEMVRQSGVFVVNFVPSIWQDVIFYCGSVSGRNVDKVAGAGLQKEEAETVNAPRLAQSLGSLECKVRQAVEVGDHTLFIGEVTRAVMRAEAPRLHHIDARITEWVDAASSGASPVPNATAAER
jgi:flavin reductase (DIM6/NTAB) family NADH-FMN oxidoreductase RutF